MLSTFFLFEGLEPMNSFPNALCGVTVLKYLINSNFDLYFFYMKLFEISDIFSINDLQSFFGFGGGFKVASVTAPM